MAMLVATACAGIMAGRAHGGGIVWPGAQFRSFLTLAVDTSSLGSVAIQSMLPFLSTINRSLPPASATSTEPNGQGSAATSNGFGLTSARVGVDRCFEFRQGWQSPWRPPCATPRTASRRSRSGADRTGAPGDREHPERCRGDVRDSGKRGEELAASSLELHDAGSRVGDEEAAVKSRCDAEHRRVKRVVGDLEVVGRQGSDDRHRGQGSHERHPSPRSIREHQDLPSLRGYTRGRQAGIRVGASY